MTESISERRLAENEVVFRRYNERVLEGFNKLREIAEEDGLDYVLDDDAPLQFYCECSDENCRNRVTLKPSRYDEIHQHRNRFVIITGHEVEKIEKIIKKEAEFCIVEKFTLPPESVRGLQVTDANNV